MKSSGIIPEKIVYIPASAVSVTCDEFSDVEEELLLPAEANAEEVKKTHTSKLSLFPIYVSDATNNTTLGSGRAWASQRSRTYDFLTKQYKVEPLPAEITRENKPFSGIRILGVEQRGNGGRAWKCHIEDGNYYIDLREHILLEAMANAGIRKGGYLEGEYIWGRETVEMRLIRVGSNLHKKLTNSTIRKNLPLIPKTDYVAGKLYQEKNGTVYLYLGNVNGWESNRSTKWWGETTKNFNNFVENKIDFYRTYTKPTDPGRIEISTREYSRSACMKIPNWNDAKTYSQKDIDALCLSPLKTIESHLNHYGVWELQSTVDIAGKFSPVQIVGEVNLDLIFPVIRKIAEDVFIRNIPYHGLKDKGFIGQKPIESKEPDFRRKERERLADACQLLPYVTIYGESGNPPKNVEEWLDWCVSKEPK